MTHEEKPGMDADKALAMEFMKLYPAEAAERLDRAPADEALSIMGKAGLPAAAEVFSRLDPGAACGLVRNMDDELFRELFTSLDPTTGAALLTRLDAEFVEKKMATLPRRVADRLRELMAYPPGTAGRLMDPVVTLFRKNDTAARAIKHIRSISGRRIVDVCIADRDGLLTGTVPLQELAVAKPDALLGDLAAVPAASIQAMAPREDVVRLLDERRLASLPVVDAEGRLVGIIRHDALVWAAKLDVSEDMQAMFGAGREERALSSVWLAMRKRLPWLEINLVTAFLAAAVVGLFEDTIAKITALAVFLPVVAGQSGNTGSQALAVTMRGLTLREIRPRQWLRIAWKEVATGLLNGIAIALTTAAVAWIWMGSPGLAVVIALAMVVSMVAAGFSGAVIPMALKAAGQDPAQSSSIVLTTVTDVVGFLSFLGLAKLLAGALGIA